jgi:hypothetical protein
MRKTVVALAGAAALAISSGASATALILSPNNPLPGPTVTPPQSGTFGNSFNPSGPSGTTFTDVYNFTLSGASLTNGSLISIALSTGDNIDFTCQTCTVQLDSNLFTLMSTGSLDVFTLSPTSLTSGPHALTVTGEFLTGTNASYSGTVNFNLPLPEASTWAMMLLGFGAIGFAMRGRQRKPVLAQVA